jgi:hypothetical protein
MGEKSPGQDPHLLHGLDLESLKMRRLESPGGEGTVEVDDFVIIPVGTPFHDLVTTVLSLHGYPKDIIRQAEGILHGSS